MTHYLQIFLTDEQNRILRELRTNTQLPQRVRDRAEVVRLNGHEWTVEKIAVYGSDPEVVVSQIACLA